MTILSGHAQTLPNIFLPSLPINQALLVLHYLLRNGSERCVSSAREHIYDMKPLEEYVFRDEQGKDQGINGESCYVMIGSLYNELVC